MGSSTSKHHQDAVEDDRMNSHSRANMVEYCQIQQYFADGLAYTAINYRRKTWKLRGSFRTKADGMADDRAERNGWRKKLNGNLIEK